MSKIKQTLHTYNYVGKNKRGRLIRGVISEKSQSLAKTALIKQGITILKISPKSSLNFGLSKKITQIDIAMFSRQMESMVKAGLPIIQSLELAASNTHNQKLKKIVSEIANDVNGGFTLANAFRKHPLVFDDLYCALLYAGEQSGAIDIMLDRLATHYEKSAALKSKISKALKYPITVVLAALIVTTILLIKVIPVFKELFSSFDAELPAFTSFVISISEFVMEYKLLLVIAPFVAYKAFIYLYKRNEIFRFSLQNLLLRLPVVGELLRKAAIARILRTLSTTVASGMQITDGLSASAKAASNIVYEQAVNDITLDVTDGLTLNQAFASSFIFPDMVVQMAAIGEETGQIDEMLDKIAVYYETEVDDLVDGLTSMLEPAIMAILGILVGGLVVAMYLPIFQMGSVV